MGPKYGRWKYYAQAWLVKTAYMGCSFLSPICQLKRRDSNNLKEGGAATGARSWHP